MRKNQLFERAGRAGVVVILAGGVAGVHGDFIWTGAGIDDLWGTAGNWTGGLVPVGSIVGDPNIVFGLEAGGGGGAYTITGAPAVSDIMVMAFTGAQGEYTIDGVNPFTFAAGAQIRNDSETSITRTQTINVDIVTNGLTVAASNGDLVLNGIISGAGGLSKTGAGRLFLNGVNTFAGDTALQGGTLVLGNDAALGAGTLNVNFLGGTLESDDNARNVANAISITFSMSVAGTNDLQLSGIIGGAGGVRKRGTSTLLLSGANTYTGTTSIDEGTLQITGGSAIADTGTVELADAAGAEFELLASETIGSLKGGGTFGGNVLLGANTLTIDENGTETFLGSIRGTGDIVHSGTGTLLLGGASTFSGGTTVTGAGATLGLGSDQALGTGTLSLTSNATLLPFGGARVIANAITVATPNWAVSGADAVDFTGAVDLTGLTTTLDVTNLGGVDFSGVIFNGALTKTGAGTLTLSGNNIYTGATNVNGGSLVLEGLVSGAVFVNAGGTLLGTGTAGAGLTNRSGGTVAPGTSIGRLNVTGDYSQETGSFLDIEVNAADGGSDVLDVSGRATLSNGSTIRVNVASPDFITAGESWTIIETDGGVFDNGTIIDTSSQTLRFEIMRGLGFMNGDLTYAIQAIREAGAFEDAAAGGNNQAIGRSLDSLVPVANMDPDGEAAGLLGQLDTLGEQEYNVALNELSPERHNAATTIDIQNVNDYTSMQSSYLTARRKGLNFFATQAAMEAGMLASATDDPNIMAAAIAAQDEAYEWYRTKDRRFGAFIRGIGSLTEEDSSTNRTGYDATTFGVQGGLDFTIKEDLYAGIGLSYTDTDGDLEQSLGDVDVESIRFGPYVSWANGPFHVDSSVTFGFNSYDVTRDMPVLNRRTKSDYDGNDVAAYVGVGLDWELDNRWTLTPSLALQYAYFDYDAVTESGGGGANLRLSDRDTDSLISRLALTSTWSTRRGLAWDVSIGWQQEYLDSDDIGARFVAGGLPFSVDTGDRDDTQFLIGTGLVAPLKTASHVFFRYEGRLGNDAYAHSFVGGWSLRF